MSESQIPFQIARVSIGLGNKTRHHEFAVGEATVECGPWRFQAYVRADGYVCLPAALQESPLRSRIAKRMRIEVAYELVGRWEGTTAREKERCR